MARRILVTWVGHNDLGAMSMHTKISVAHQSIIDKIFEKKNINEGFGPIKGLTDSERFDEVHLIGNEDESLLRKYLQWINIPGRVHSIKIENPSEHSEIYRLVVPILESLKLDTRDELCFHLSPGTAAMASIWILLGKSKFPATLFQTYFDPKSKTSRVWKTEIPFDITVDVLPQFMREPDRLMQHLMTHSPQETQGFESIIGDS